MRAARSSCQSAPRSWLLPDGDDRLTGLWHFFVALPAFVLQLDMLNRDCVRVCVEVRQRLVFRDPASIDLIRDGLLTGLVIDLDNDLFAKVLERDLRTKTRAEVPYL